MPIDEPKPEPNTSIGWPIWNPAIAAITLNGVGTGLVPGGAEQCVARPPAGVFISPSQTQEKEPPVSTRSHTG